MTGGIQADLRVVSDAEFPFALAYFTGSKEHNIVMRQRAIQRGLRLNEYGLFKSKEETRDPKLARAVQDRGGNFRRNSGWRYIPPELREDHGEFAAAEKGELPRLLEWTELQGSLHNHSNWSDGHEPLEEIASHMHELGCDYWAITDHSKSSFQAHGLDPARVRQQIKEVKAINHGLRMKALISVCSPARKWTFSRTGWILMTICWPNSTWSSPVSMRFLPKRSREHQTPDSRRGKSYVHMLGHLTGRLLLEREAYKVAELVDHQQPGSGVEPQHVRPAALAGGAGAAGGEVLGGGEVDPVPGLDRGAGQPDREHRLADPGRADEQDVGGLVEEPQRRQVADQRLVDAGLGGVVEVGQGVAGG